MFGRASCGYVDAGACLIHVVRLLVVTVKGLIFLQRWGRAVQQAGEGSSRQRARLAAAQVQACVLTACAGLLCVCQSRAHLIYILALVACSINIQLPAGVHGSRRAAQAGEPDLERSLGLGSRAQPWPRGLWSHAWDCACPTPSQPRQRTHLTICLLG